MLSFASKDHSWEGPPSPEVEEREEGRGWVRRIGSEKMEKRQGRERRRREKEGGGGRPAGAQAAGAGHGPLLR